MTFSPHLWKIKWPSRTLNSLSLCFADPVTAWENIKAHRICHCFIFSFWPLIQGLTEFLPVSSSGHLILLPSLTGASRSRIGNRCRRSCWHLVRRGTCISGPMCAHCTNWVAHDWREGRVDTDGARLALYLAIATIPVVIAGLIFKITGLNDLLRSAAVIGWTMLIFGIVLYWADRTGAQTKTDSDWSMKDAITMGLAQVLALIPGTSRSGITITAARKLGYAREDGAKLAMLICPSQRSLHPEYYSALMSSIKPTGRSHAMLGLLRHSHSSQPWFHLC